MRRWLLALLIAGFAVSCARVLGFPDKNGPRPFEHRAHVLRGIACTTCHQGIGVTGDTGPLHLPGTDKCVTCHQKPHDSHECSNCHGQESTRFAVQQARDHLRFSHARHMPQVKGNCVRCHSGVAEQGSVLRPKMGTCFSCHQHEDMYRTRECDRCHVSLPEELSRPSDHLIHDGDWLREHGTRAASTDLCASCHRERFCASCHARSAPALPETIRFADTMRAGVHRAGFRSRHSEEARAQPGLCNTCHTEDTCRRCHQANGVDAVADDMNDNPRSPHRPGWLGPPGTANLHGRAAWRDPVECAACHGGAGESLCIGCHRVGGVGGNPHPAGWSSRLSKRDLPCLLCHGGAP